MSVNNELKEAGLSARVCLIVFLDNASDQFKLRRYGDIVYFSKKMKYCVIYVNDDEANKIETEINQLNFVRTVQRSEDENVDLSSEHIEKQISDLAQEADNILQEKNEDLLN